MAKKLAAAGMQLLVIDTGGAGVGSPAGLRCIDVRLQVPGLASMN